MEERLARAGVEVFSFKEEMEISPEGEEAANAMALALCCLLSVALEVEVAVHHRIFGAQAVVAVAELF
jgi:hypothetical protein